MENLTNSTIDNGTLELENSALKHLDETRKWTLFLSILGFVFIGLMFVVAIIMVIVGSSNAIPGLSAAMLLPLLLVCVLYFFPIYYLFQFSSYSKQALIKKDNSLLTKAIQYLKMQFRFMGILAIIMLCIYIIAIVIAVAAGSFFNMFQQ